MIPASVRRDLHFNGYRRGVVVGMRGAHVGSVEEIWQFRRPTGAQAWYVTYAASNRPGPNSQFAHSFTLNRRGALGFSSKRVDASGYHFGVGVALVGDMIVHVRVFGTAPVTRREIASQLRRATRPVARGITPVRLPAMPVRHHKSLSVST